MVLHARSDGCSVSIVERGGCGDDEAEGATLAEAYALCPDRIHQKGGNRSMMRGMRLTIRWTRGSISITLEPY
jgi:hypothetical protein